MPRLKVSPLWIGDNRRFIGVTFRFCPRRLRVATLAHERVNVDRCEAWPVHEFFREPKVLFLEHQVLSLDDSNSLVGVERPVEFETPSQGVYDELYKVLHSAPISYYI